MISSREYNCMQKKNEQETCFFLMVTELYSRNENEVKKLDQGTKLENEDKQSCHFCTRHEDKQSCQTCTQHSMLTCSIILPSIIKIFLMVTEFTLETKMK